MSAASNKSDRRDFWHGMSLDLFKNVKELYEQIDSQFQTRTAIDGKGIQMVAFCVYSCGYLACYLHKYPYSKTLPQPTETFTPFLNGDNGKDSNVTALQSVPMSQSRSRALRWCSAVSQS